jgi:predicted dehydrogenase
LNWDLFQGPAQRHPYKVGRQRSWRSWWDYGGGLITDWGVHLTDVALWYLQAQTRGPLMTTGSAQYVSLVNPDRDQAPDAFAVTWQYPEFVMTFTNVMPAAQPGEFDRRGNYFFGPRGSLLVNRTGYEVRPTPPSRGGAPPPEPLLQYKRVSFVQESDADPHTIAHARNFLDCVKSRQKPVSDLEIGFYASLPCMLGVMAVREGRSFKWNDPALEAVPV